MTFQTIKDILRKKGGLPRGLEARVKLEWKALLFLFCFGLLALSAMTFGLYRDIDSGKDGGWGQKGAVSAELLPQKLLDTVIDKYETKAETFAALRHAAAVSVDPSR